MEPNLWMEYEPKDHDAVWCHKSKCKNTTNKHTESSIEWKSTHCNSLTSYFVCVFSQHIDIGHKQPKTIRNYDKKETKLKISIWSISVWKSALSLLNNGAFSFQLYFLYIDKTLKTHIFFLSLFASWRTAPSNLCTQTHINRNCVQLLHRNYFTSWR